MTSDILHEKDFYKTSDLALAATLSLFYPIEAIERKNKEKKVYFFFKRDEKLDELIEAFWKGELRVEPKAFFNQLKMLKSRIYSMDST